MKPRIALRVLPLSLILVLAACVTEDDNSTEATPPPGDALVEVLLGEFSIEMPAEVGFGTISFEISNVGEMGHSFAIEGPGVSEQLESELSPTGTEVLTLELEPGTYTVWCPIGDHRDQGMEATLTVTDEPAEGGGTTLDGIGPSEEQEPIEGDGG
jgi:hypothetical protein